MATLFIRQSECRALLNVETILPELKNAFVSYSTIQSKRALRVRSEINNKGSSTVLFPGMIPGIPAYSVKIHAKFPDQNPAIRGVLCLHDIESGVLLAVMDSTYLTSFRTGLIGALSAHTLANSDAGFVAVIGAGVQGYQQLLQLAALRTLKEVWVFDTNRGKAVAYARTLNEELNIPINVADSAEHSVGFADIILTATWATEPFILSGMLKPGVHITALGADEPGKAEVSAEVLKNSLFVCDDRQLAVEMGALCGVGLGQEIIGAELGEVLAGHHPGRTSRDQTTVFGGVGLAFQDLVVAWAIYNNALQKGVGEEVNFFD